MHRYDPQNIGEFQEVEYGNRFTYRKIQDEWAVSHGCTHEIDVGMDEIRFAKVHKTVAYVSVDEDEFGNPVFERWSIKNHSIYDKE